MWLDDDPLAFNFALAENRQLCLFGSAGVLGLQLAMPCVLFIEAAFPSSGVFSAAFALAWSFHMGNHILWRINFFGSWCPALLVLLSPVRQMSLGEIAASSSPGAILPPIALLVVYFILQLGHAMDRASEKLLANWRSALLARDNVPTAAGSFVLACLWVIELCLLGDYYTSYWPETHPHRPPATVACIVVKFSSDGKKEEEALLPGAVCYYWRRDINGRILWPQTADSDCELTDESIWRNVQPGAEAPPLPSETLSLSEVAARIGSQLEHTFLPVWMLTRLRGFSPTMSIHLRVRTLEYHGTALRVKCLYDYPLRIVRERRE